MAITEVIHYQTDDGQIFYVKEDALEYARGLNLVKKAMEPILSDRPDLSNGAYMQHDMESVMKVKKDLYEILESTGLLSDWLSDQINVHGRTREYMMYQCHPSYFDRLLDSSRHPICRAYRRMCCIDRTGREWDQPYYAIQADKEMQLQ